MIVELSHDPLNQIQRVKGLMAELAKLCLSDEVECKAWINGTLHILVLNYKFEA
jgi:hypothetical protein